MLLAAHAREQCAGHEPRVSRPAVRWVGNCWRSKVAKNRGFGSRAGSEPLQMVPLELFFSVFFPAASLLPPWHDVSNNSSQFLGEGRRHLPRHTTCPTSTLLPDVMSSRPQPPRLCVRSVQPSADASASPPGVHTRHDGMAAASSMYATWDTCMILLYRVFNRRVHDLAQIDCIDVECKTGKLLRSRGKSGNRWYRCNLPGCMPRPDCCTRRQSAAKATASGGGVCGEERTKRGCGSGAVYVYNNNRVCVCLRLACGLSSANVGLGLGFTHKQQQRVDGVRPLLHSGTGLQACLSVATCFCSGAPTSPPALLAAAKTSVCKTAYVGTGRLLLCVCLYILVFFSLCCLIH